MTVALLTVALIYAVFVARGVRRSKRRGNIMASTFRRRHSWRWWVWTACARPDFWSTWEPRRAGVWIRRRRLPLPFAWFPAHMRRTPREEAVASAKQAYIRGYCDEAELEKRIGRALGL